MARASGKAEWWALVAPVRFAGLMLARCSFLHPPPFLSSLPAGLPQPGSPFRCRPAGWRTGGPDLRRSFAGSAPAGSPPFSALNCISKIKQEPALAPPLVRPAQSQLSYAQISWLSLSMLSEDTVWDSAPRVEGHFSWAQARMLSYSSANSRPL